MLTVNGGITGELSEVGGITGELSIGYIKATYTDDGNGNITISSAASASGGDIILEVE